MTNLEHEAFEAYVQKLRGQIADAFDGVRKLKIKEEELTELVAGLRGTIALQIDEAKVMRDDIDKRELQEFWNNKSIKKFQRKIRKLEKQIKTDRESRQANATGMKPDKQKG